MSTIDTVRLGQLGACLSGRADGIGATAETVRVTASSGHWSSAAAREFAYRLDGLLAQARACADGLDGLVDRLNRHAAAAGRHQAELSSVVTAVADALR